MAAKQMQMIPKSSWKVTQDHTFQLQYYNPEFVPAMYHAEDELYADEKGLEWHDPKRTNQEVRNKACEKHVIKNGIAKILTGRSIELKAGEIIEITGKSTNSLSGHINKDYIKFAGIFFPVEITETNGKKRQEWLPYAAMEPVVELLNETIISVFALRDTKTNKLFKEIEYETGWYVKGISWVEKYTQSKRWSDLNKLRLWIMGKTGYYVGMAGADSQPDWMGSSKEIDIENSWEIVEYNKLTKEEIKVVDLQTWYKRLWQLRDLTIKFGSPVRNLYNEIDKKGELDNFKGMLVLRTPVETIDNGRYGQYQSYSEYELDPNDVALIDDAIKTNGLKRTEIKRKKDKNCIAIAFKTLDQAVMLKLTYTGQLRLDCIDLETLKETVAS